MSDKQKTLEDLVPPLELCNKIPQKRERVAEYFNGSALVWAFSEPDMGWQVLPRAMTEFNDCPIYPAPTLAELLGMLPDGTTLKKDDVSVWISWKLNTVRDQNPAAAALRLLMRVKGVGK